MNMSNWKRSIIEAGHVSTIPIMTYPGLQLTGLKMMDVLTSGKNQSFIIEALSDRYPSPAAAVTFMDLSVEAEAFGADVLFSDQEVPTVVGSIVRDYDSVMALQVPTVGEKRTGEFVYGMERAARADASARFRWREGCST